MTNDMLNVKQVRLGNWRLRSHTDNARWAEFKLILPFPSSTFEHKFFHELPMANFFCSTQCFERHRHVTHPSWLLRSWLVRETCRLSPQSPKQLHGTGHRRTKFALMSSLQLQGFPSLEWIIYGLALLHIFLLWQPVVLQLDLQHKDTSVDITIITTLLLLLLQKSNPMYSLFLAVVVLELLRNSEQAKGAQL